jgi:MFS family permease
MYLCVPKLSPYAHEIGADYAMIGLINGSYGFSQMIIRVPLGILSDRLGRRKGLIFLGFILTLLSGIVAWLAPSPLTLLFMRMLQGGSAATYLAYTVIYSEYFDEKHSQRAVGTITALFTVGQIVGLAGAGIMSFYWGYPMLFPLTALVAFTGLLLAIPVHETPLPHEEKAPFGQLAAMILHGPLLRVAVLGILSQIVTFGAVFGFLPLTAKALGADDFALSVLAILGMIPGVFLPAVTSRLFKKGLDPRLTVSAGFLISALFCLAVPVTKSLNLLYLFQFLGGFGRGIVFPVLMGLAIRGIPKNRRGTVMGMYQSFYGIGMFAGPVIFGFVAKKAGLPAAYLTGTAASLLGVFLAFIIPGRKSHLPA